MAVVRVQWRRGTAAEWTAANPTLAAGEPGLETDTGKFKIGNGIDRWNDLLHNTLDLGTMALQMANAVAITGGTIGGTTTLDEGSY